MTTPPIVFAYLDPGTGSYLLQLASPARWVPAYAVKHFWARIKGLFSRSGPTVQNDARG